MEQQLVRLNKYLKDAGICSRRKADEFIAKGYVKVNGHIITELGLKVNPKSDKIELSSDIDAEKAKFCYMVLNKPKGYVCSKSDVDGKTIFELVPTIPGLTYAGRLDKDSQGLVILSNDGKFVYGIAGKEFAREKSYIVRVDKPLTDNYLKVQANGTIMLEGKQVRRAQVKQISQNVYLITLTEGMNRQIRKMADNQGYNVLDLKRISIGCITDHNLTLGRWRHLTAAEIKALA